MTITRRGAGVSVNGSPQEVERLLQDARDTYLSVEKGDMSEQLRRLAASRILEIDSLLDSLSQFTKEPVK